MKAQNLSGKVMEFEQVPGRSDVQVSKVLETATGDKIRAIFTTGNSVMLTAVGQVNGNTVILTSGSGSMPDDPTLYLSWWEVVKKGAGALIGEFLGGGSGSGGSGSGGSGSGGGQTCTTTTNVKLGEGGQVEDIVVTTTCSTSAAA